MILGLPFWRRERLQGYLTIFTINNVVRDLVVELNLRSVEAFLRFSSAVQVDRRADENL